MKGYCVVVMWYIHIYHKLFDEYFTLMNYLVQLRSAASKEGVLISLYAYGCLIVN